MVGEQQSYDETNLDIYTDDDIDPLENRIQLFHEKLEKKQEEDANLRKLLRDKGLESQEGLQKQIGLEAQESLQNYKMQEVELAMVKLVVLWVKQGYRPFTIGIANWFCIFIMCFSSCGRIAMMKVF